jgi:rhodanese-related sulfurtransferase
MATLRSLTLALGFSAAALADSRDSPTPQSCSASLDYLARTFASLEKDYSCFTDLISLGQKRNNFQLIDIRPSAATAGVGLTGAWLMPVSELKLKSFLQKKPLLLVGDSFSRAEAARDCALLKKSGFTSAKILLGGVDAWTASQHSTINAQQLMFEYFNGQVVIIAMSTQVGDWLKALGFTQFHTLSRYDEQKVSEIASTTSNNGYDPVVLVTADGVAPVREQKSLPRIYFLAGGMLALQAQVEKNLWTNHNRTTANSGGFCAAK